MVLRGHRHPTGGVVDDRDVDAAVPKHHLVGRQAQRAAQDLVAETDAEQRDSGAQHLAGKRDDVIGGGRVAGAVGQEHAMRVEFGDLLEGGRCRQHMAANPRRAKLRGVLVLIPRSRAATVNLETPGGPSGSTTYGSAVLTSPARSAPSIDCCARTRAIKSAGSASAPSENTPAFIDPRLRRWRTTARVSMPAIPTMRWRMSSSSNVPVARQLDARGDGSRTA